MIKSDMAYKKRVGRNIRRLRMEKGISQIRMSEMLGISPQAVSRWELGDALPHSSKLTQIAGILGVATDELLK